MNSTETNLSPSRKPWEEVPDTPFNKRKRRRRNKKGNGGSDDRQPAMQDTASLKNLDGKKVAAVHGKCFWLKSPKRALP